MANVKIGIDATSILPMSFKALADVDYSKLYEIADKVHSNRSLIGDFDKDWEAAALAINGYKAPAGFHMHIVDGNNVYHPAEDSALEQISSKGSGEAWTRIEVRAGQADIACIICLWCGGKSSI